MIIDAHIHVGAWDHPDFLGRACDLAGTLTTLRGAGVDGAVLMPSDRFENAGLREGMKRAIAAGFAGPLWFFPWLRPGSAGAGDLAFARAHRADVGGIKVHPSLSRVRITDDTFRPVLELAEELDRPVLVHCGRWAEIAGFAHAIEAATRHPRVRFLLAHAGGDTPPNASGAAAAVKAGGLTNVWFEFAGLREYWVVERNVRLLGVERYLFGSDFPLAHPLMYIGAVRGMDLDDAQRRRILGENAMALLGQPMTAS